MKGLGESGHPVEGVEGGEGGANMQFAEAVLAGDEFLECTLPFADATGVLDDEGNWVFIQHPRRAGDRWALAPGVRARSLCQRPRGQ